MRRLLTVLFLVASASATNYTVKSGGGGNFTTMAACASQMSTNGTGVSDTCTVFAGTYNENVTVPAGSVGNYKIFTVNGSDVITTLSFTLNSHTKLIGNCPEKQGTITTATCGFFIANPSSPGAAPCVSTSTTATDVYIVHNVMYACANGIGNTGSTSGAAIYVPSTGTFIYIQGNTCSYPAATVASPVFTGKCIDIGEPNTSSGNVVTNILIENNDFSHYTLGVKFSSQHSIFRNNSFHDQLETEGSSNKHTDIFFSEQLFNVLDNVIEGNFERNSVGPNAKGVLAQGDNPCSGCTNLIVRFDVTSRIGSGVSSNYPTWPHIMNYNNTHVDLNMDASCTSQDTDLNYLVPNASLLNQLYYYNTPCAWSNWNSGSCLSASCNYGHNLYWCTGAGCASPYNHQNSGPSLWLTDPGNQHADPLFVNYVSPGSTSNNYHLQAGSPAIAAGTFLTTVAAGDSGSGTSLVVTDASYFQDGYSLTNANSTVFPDCISVTTVTNHICITAVNYATNTLTMASGFSRSNGDHVWLYSKSDGVQVLTGTAPDMGAFPFASAPTQATQPSCTPGTGIYGANQTVACANPNSGTTVMCYTTNGATPATNGLGTACTTGTVYTAPFSVSTLTLKVIAGSSTLTDSTVASYAYTITVAAPALPILWVDNNEGNSNYTYVLNFPGTWVSATPSGWPTVLPYASTAAGAQQVILDMESYRTSTGKGTRTHWPAGFLYSAANGPYIPQTNTVQSAQFNVLDSTDDPNLPNGTTACSHGLQDNLATSTDPGLHNPSCDGKNMYDELGPQNGGGVITGITTLSSHTTTLAAITLNASAQLVPLANGYVSPANSYVVDTGINAETVVGVSGVNQTGIFGVFTKNHASGVSVTYDVGSITLANGTVVTTASYNDVQHMWTSECTGANCTALRFCSPVGGGATSAIVPACGSGTLAPDHWLIMDMEARPAAVFINGSTPTPVQMNGSGSETSAAQFPQHILFRKIWPHSDWTSLNVGINPIGNCMYLSGSYISLEDSQCSQNLRPGNEGHSLLLQGVGPYKINHDWLEGMSSGIFAGGNCGAWPNTSYVPAQDMEIRRTRLTRPYFWLGGNMSGNTHWSGNSLVLKNTEELKAGERILFDGDIWENVDSSGGQSGPVSDFNVRNDSCNPGSNYQMTIADVTVSNLTARNACEGPEIDRSSVGGSGAGQTYGVYRVGFINDILYGISGTANPNCNSANRGFAFENSGGNEWQGAITGNGTTATFVANCSVNQGKCLGQISSLAVASAGTGCAANGSLVISAPNLPNGRRATGTYTCSAGALTGVTLGALPFGEGSGYTSAPTVAPATGTGTVTVTMVTSAVAPTTGAQALSMNAGDPVPITDCNSNTAFDNVTLFTISGRQIPNQGGPGATAGSTAWNGTPVAGNLTVSYPSAVSGSDASGFCTLSTVQGGPFNLTVNHVTLISDTSTNAISGNNSPTSGANLALNGALQNSIVALGGWVASPFSEATQTEELMFNATTLSTHHWVWSGRTAANYTEFGNNARYPDSAGCTGAGCHPGTTLYFPATSFCSGSTATSACVGFAGAMSAASMPITLPDYHSFALVSSSLFKAGGTQDASDGTDMGPNIPALDAAQTLNQYVCATACGSGPFPDVIQSASVSAPCVACMISKANVPSILEAASESFWNSSLRRK